MCCIVFPKEANERSVSPAARRMSGAVPPAGTVAQFTPPFQHYYGSKLAFAVKVPNLESFSDSVDQPHRSHFVRE
jgi:hypothetical protein